MIGLIREGLYRLRGRQRYAKLRELLATQYLPEEELRRRQLLKLRSVLHHAWSTVPWYRRHFDELGITPDDIRSFADFASLPLLTRQDLEQHTSELLSDAIPESERFKNASGGTTGEPVRFFQDKGVLEAMDADWLFCCSFAGWQPSDMIINIWGNPRDCTTTEIPGGVKPWLAGTLSLNAYRYGKNELAAWLKVIKRYRRVFLYGYTTVLADLAEHVLECRAKGTLGDLRNVGGVLTTAEKLHPSQRKAIEDAFGCRAHDQYGSREVPGVGIECECGNMHLLTHAAYAEFVPLAAEELEAITFGVQDGPEGENGGDRLPRRIVLTGFSNRAMPVIRYAIGDYGAPKEGPCACGRGFPLMRMDIGRIGDTLLAPDGRRLYGSYFIRHVSGVKGVGAFQFRQTALEAIQLFVIPGSGFSDETRHTLEELQRSFPEKVCPGSQLHLHYVEDLPRTPAGKHRQVICEVQS